MDRLILENFRCFKTRQEVAIRPLTILVGENSTGKTSFLAAIRLAAGLGREVKEIDFNQEPFSLGAFDQIASFAGGRGGRAKSFLVGYDIDHRILDPYIDRDQLPIRVQGIFRSKLGQPFLSELRVSWGTYKVSIVAPKDTGNPTVEMSKGEEKVTFEGDMPAGREGMFNLRLLSFMAHQQKRVRKHSKRTEIANALDELAFGLYREIGEKPYAIAPVRTKPERTYDPKSDIPRPEGNHVPMVLANAASSGMGDWSELKGRMTQFGTMCGLFSDIRIRRLGRSASDPFQILVTVSGAAANLMDVGYGVSQVLPILVDVLSKNRNQLFLMQQPEVHLHPRAQAELGTFLGHMVKREKKRFVVETHSDNLIDRVCLDIRDRKTGLAPHDVLILYFERGHPWVSIYPIEIDANGNIVGAPPGYRSFFLKEQSRLFKV